MKQFGVYTLILLTTFIDLNCIKKDIILNSNICYPFALGWDTLTYNDKNQVIAKRNTGEVTHYFYNDKGNIVSSSYETAYFKDNREYHYDNDNILISIS